MPAGRAGFPGRVPGPSTEQFEHRFRPLSAGVCVPVFAFLSAGVTVGGPAGLGAALTEPVVVGIVAGLVVGKSVGVLGAAWIVARLTDAELDQDLACVDVFGLSLLAGIGFTVSLLIGELAFGLGSERDGQAKAAVLAGSVLAAGLAAVVLRIRDGVHRRIAEAEDAGPVPAVDGDTAG
jgi:NhaA family Na+:H+ antiporter